MVTKYKQADRGRGHMKKRTYKRKAYRRKTYKKSSLVSLIKSINVKQAESKYKSISVDYPAMVHGNLYKQDIWSSSVNLFPGQNSTDSGRLGDRIIAQGIMLRAIFDIPWDRKNCRLKAFYVPYNSDQGNPADYSTFFHNITGESRLDPVQKKRFPGVKYLGTYTIEPERASYYTYGSGTSAPANDEVSANTGTICIKKWIPMYNKKVFMKADASNQPSNLKENGCVVIVPYATLNTSKDGVLLPGDTIVISGKLNATLYFKDL